MQRNRSKVEMPARGARLTKVSRRSSPPAEARRPLPPRATHSAHGLPRSKVPEELIGEAARVGEREEMAAWKLVDGDL
jgi:hypothetical protein